MGVLLALTVESVHSLRRSHHFFLSLSTTPSSRSWGTTSNDRSKQLNFLFFFCVFFIPSWSDHRVTFLCLSFLFFSFFSLFFFLVFIDPYIVLSNVINPSTPMSDQGIISPYIINTISSRQVMRTKKKINKGIIS